MEGVWVGGVAIASQNHRANKNLDGIRGIIILRFIAHAVNVLARLVEMNGVATGIVVGAHFLRTLFYSFGEQE